MRAFDSASIELDTGRHKTVHAVNERSCCNRRERKCLQKFDMNSVRTEFLETPCCTAKLIVSNVCRLLRTRVKTRGANSLPLKASYADFADKLVPERANN